MYHKLQVLMKKISENIFSCQFSSIFGHQSPGSGFALKPMRSTTLASTNRAKANCFLFNRVLKILFSAQLSKLLYSKQLNNVSS
jgi:hypothetical protein